MSRNTLIKAIRLVREGHVQIADVQSDEMWNVTVQGDTGTYLAGRTPEGPFCNCAWGVRRSGPCSHVLAGEAVVAGALEKLEAQS